MRNKPLCAAAGVLVAVALLAVALTLLAAGCGCGAGGPMASPDSGITGLVTIGPISPVEQAGEPNDKPYASTLQIEDAKGKTVAKVASDPDGRFTVALAPGSYTIEPQNGHPYPVAPPQEVTVAPHRFTSVTVSYDSGIR
jgi:hypothetical protein